MCNRKSQTKSVEYLSDYYSASYDKIIEEIYGQQFHENAFDYKPMPIVTAGKPNELQMFHWGFVPSDAKNEFDAGAIKKSTVNCRSEDMFKTRSFRDAASKGQRCLIPCTGYYEYQWMDPDGKLKIPHFISLIDQELFSMAGIYSSWKNPVTGLDYFSYSLLTTAANPFIAKIHNSGERMPVIIPREYERDWLNSNLTKEDVLAMCISLEETKMKAHTVSKLLTKRGVDTNVAEAQAPFQYEPIKDTVKKNDTNGQRSLLF